MCVVHDTHLRAAGKAYFPKHFIMPQNGTPYPIHLRNAHHPAPLPQSLAASVKVSIGRILIIPVVPASGTLDVTLGAGCGPAIFVSLVPPLLQVNAPVFVSHAVGHQSPPHGHGLLTVFVDVVSQVGFGPGIVVVMVGKTRHWAGMHMGQISGVAVTVAV